MAIFNILNLVLQFADNKLKFLLNNCRMNATYWYKTIQNKIINILWDHIKEQITKEVKKQLGLVWLQMKPLILVIKSKWQLYCVIFLKICILKILLALHIVKRGHLVKHYLRWLICWKIWYILSLKYSKTLHTFIIDYKLFTMRRETTICNWNALPAQLPAQNWFFFYSIVKVFFQQTM